MKIIAYYLPQFHEVEENNKWWGEGFTEWVSTKNAEKLFEKHDQPKEPLDNNYYNIMNREIVEWQTYIASKYNIYGFCYYHYWFSGDKLLEKPVENLLAWTDIEQKFCFCWANHSWYKSKDGKKQILKEQTYGNIEEWDEHFNYLIEFFNDDRYIKVNNKPLFIIYDSKSIPNINDRVAFYDKKCKENGFSGISIVESINQKKYSKKCNLTENILLREPAIAFSNISFMNRLKRKVKMSILNMCTGRKIRVLDKVMNLPIKYSYDMIWSNIVKFAENTLEKEKNIYLGAFTNWDNTPRHGIRGSVIINNNIEIFKKNMWRLKNLGDKYDVEFLFINAWNEWAEGMYLEPDTKMRYAYLEIIRDIYK